MSKWREGWDFKPMGSGRRVLVHAVGPEYVCEGVESVPGHLFPDDNTMDKVYADARLISIAPEMRDALRDARASISGRDPALVARIDAIFRRMDKP